MPRLVLFFCMPADLADVDLSAAGGFAASATAGLVPTPLATLAATPPFPLAGLAAGVPVPVLGLSDTFAFPAGADLAICDSPDRGFAASAD